jgi:type III secretory pathway component EscS
MFLNLLTSMTPIVAFSVIGICVALFIGVVIRP